ncbi:MAG: grasp-with-spasm system ATP-grasp peptide maturase [Bacteroidales bacterium]|nr:grasp-with-spasm system ATP-grasp peptide maturase [Bacteroidales bacterium]
MILLLSSSGDYSTRVIVKWLKHFGYKDYLRIDAFDFVKRDIKILPAEGVFVVNDNAFNFESVSVVWYRRFGGYATTPHYRYVKDCISETVAEQLKHELENICEYFVSLIPTNNIIGSTRKGNTNKLIELFKANQAGLNVAHTVVVSNKKLLLEAINDSGSLIAKSAYNAVGQKYKFNNYTQYTSRISEKDIEQFPETFFPSMVQQELKKDYEVRMLYLLGEIYCMAIISQDNKQTEVDYRKYDTEIPNRFIPCEVDDETKRNVSKFMKSMDLNIGSLDFIRGLDGKLYFLEVNHMGQFGMVDNPCNYGIHRHIAELLIRMDRDEKQRDETFNR